MTFKRDKGYLWLLFNNVNQPPISGKRNNKDNEPDDVTYTIGYPSPPARAKATIVVSFPPFITAIDPYNDVSFIGQLLDRNHNRIVGFVDEVVKHDPSFYPFYLEESQKYHYLAAKQRTEKMNETDSD